MSAIALETIGATRDVPRDKYPSLSYFISLSTENLTYNIKLKGRFLFIKDN